jgi:hypothetical protein
MRILRGTRFPRPRHYRCHRRPELPVESGFSRNAPRFQKTKVKSVKTVRYQALRVGRLHPRPATGLPSTLTRRHLDHPPSTRIGHHHPRADPNQSSAPTAAPRHMAADRTPLHAPWSGPVRPNPRRTAAPQTAVPRATLPRARLQRRTRRTLHRAGSCSSRQVTTPLKPLIRSITTSPNLIRSLLNFFQLANEHRPRPLVVSRPDPLPRGVVSLSRLAEALRSRFVGIPAELLRGNPFAFLVLQFSLRIALPGGFGSWGFRLACRNLLLRKPLRQ